MELDFETVKALSSPTRVLILREVLEKEATTTQLSDNLGKSKSTVSSHLKTLTDAELVEKDKVEGRKRVTYRPTRKAEAIVKGRERKVKFSIASTIVTTFTGVAFTGIAAREIFFTGSSEAGSMAAQDTQMSMMARSAEMAPNASQAASDSASILNSVNPESAFLMMGVGFLGIAALSLLYGMLIKKLTDYSSK